MRAMLLLGLLLISACQSGDAPQSPVTRPATATASSSPRGPYCFETPYGKQKAGFDGRQRIFGRTPSNAPSIQSNLKAPAQRITTQDSKLATPPEITAIERGYVYQWVGGFINDGLATWEGIDLDRQIVISISRRVWDARAQLSRRFQDPVFSDNDQTSFARKWSSDQRVETEVVQIRRFTPYESIAFTCVANGAWMQTPRPAPHMMTDTFRAEATIYDRQFDQDDAFRYSKTVDANPFRVIRDQSAVAVHYKWD